MHRSHDPMTVVSASRRPCFSSLTGRAERHSQMPKTGCLICRNRLTEGDEIIHLELCLCWHCARKITNRYTFRYTGKYFDWPNPPDPIPLKPQRKPISASKRIAVFRRDGFKCSYCGNSPEVLHLDHIVPLAKGGTDEISNLTVCCARCNSKKRTKSVKQFTVQLEYGGSI